jgi:hypothetical protein
MSNVTAPEHLNKQPGERRKFSIDFTNVLDGAIISGIPLLSSTTIGGEESDLVLDYISSTDNVIYFFAESGTHTVRYRGEATIETDDGQRLIGDFILRVTDI